MDHSGFGCISLRPEGPGGDGIPARAAFITEASVARARQAGGRLDAEQSRRMPDLRYGDLLVIIEDPKSGPRGRHVRAGRDAGLAIEVPGVDGFARRVPFTGANMMKARDALVAAKTRAKGMSLDAERALEGINGVFEIICASPDPERFTSEQIGQAYLCGMFEAAGSMELSVSPAQFGRKSRADMIRAQISRVSRIHPDGLFHVDDLGMILSDLGVEPVLQSEKQTFDTGQDLSEPALRRMISASPQLRNDVFGALTATRIDAIDILAIGSEDFDTIIEELSEFRLQAQWVDLMRERVTGIMSPAGTRARVDLEMISIDGRDIMLMREGSSHRAGVALLYSWPSVDRLSVSEIGAHRHLLVAPEEIPEEDEIRALAATLGELRVEMALDAEQRQMRS